QALATKLTGENDSLRKRLTDAEADLRTARDGARGSINQQLAALEQTRRSLAEKQQQLTAATQELSTLRTAASAAGAVSDRVRQLEAEKATLADQLSAAERARVTVATVSPVPPSANASPEVERKLADALRSFSETSRERDELLAEVNALSAQLAVASTTIARLESNPRTQPASSLETPRPRVDPINRGPQPTARNEPSQSPPAQIERAATAVAATPVRSVNPIPVASGALAAPTRPSSAPPGPDVVAAAPAPAPRTHNVGQGDTLSSISRQYYGTSNRWQDILAANRDVLRNERDLVVGRTLRLP
ncbi:MAG: LysM peptidoglycan-binding domain-containing protein, partial [Tepidisphaeraceae bacterium]